MDPLSPKTFSSFFVLFSKVFVILGKLLFFGFSKVFCVSFFLAINHPLYHSRILAVSNHSVLIPQSSHWAFPYGKCRRELCGGFRHELGERGGILSYEEATAQVQGQKLIGPQQKPLKSNRSPGDLSFIDLPIRDMAAYGGKVWRPEHRRDHHHRLRQGHCHRHLRHLFCLC